MYWLHKLTQSMSSKGCVFVKCQGLSSYLLSLVPLVIFLQAECITEKRGKMGRERGGREKNLLQQDLFCTNTNCLPQTQLRF